MYVYVFIVQPTLSTSSGPLINVNINISRMLVKLGTHKVKQLASNENKCDSDRPGDVAINRPSNNSFYRGLH